MNGWVWVLAPHDDYVRGQEIIEVRRVPGRTGAFHVEITQARGDDRERGAGVNSYTLWTLPTAELATAAILGLLEALSGEVPGVVVLDEQNEAKLVSFADLAAGA